MYGFSSLPVCIITQQAYAYLTVLIQYHKVPMIS